jgi:signal transduction histidine kinase
VTDADAAPRGLVGPYGDPRWGPWLGPALTLGALLVIEIAAHGPFPAPEPLPVTLLVTSLLAVVYAGLRGGFVPALASAALVALYTMHLLSPHRAWLAFDAAALRSGGLMLVIGGVMGAAMAGVKRREDKLRGALLAKARDLEERNLDLRRANETLEAFTYVVGHDLKEPVRAIENYLAAAEEEYGTPDGRGFVAKAHAANRRMARLLHGLLAYSRASSGPAEAEDLSLQAALESDAVRAQLDPLLAERGAALEVNPGIPPICANEVVLGQAFANLILNALRHNPTPGPRVAVREGGSDDRSVEVLVDDNGPGFPPEVLRSFGHLRDGNPTTVKGGFGLIIAHRAVQRMGGDMWLEKNPEGGARVRVRLPRARGPPARAPVTPASRQAGRG